MNEVHSGTSIQDYGFEYLFWHQKIGNIETIYKQQRWKYYRSTSLQKPRSRQQALDGLGLILERKHKWSKKLETTPILNIDTQINTDIEPAML